MEHPLHEGLLGALRRRADIELVVLEPWKRAGAGECDVVLSVDDGPAPRHPQARRYGTEGPAAEHDVVATRSQLQPGGPVVCVAFPVADDLLRSDPLDPTDASRIAVFDRPASVRDVREAMAVETAIVGVRDDPVLRDCIRDRTDGLLVRNEGEAAEVAEALHRTPDEVDRLGLEARAAVARASWRAIARALLRRPLASMPRLRDEGALGVGPRWALRLGSASRWAAAQPDDAGLLLSGDAGATTRMDLQTVSPLRRRIIQRALAAGDAREPEVSGTVPGDAEGPATPNAPRA